MSAQVYRFSTNALAGADRTYAATGAAASGKLNQGFGTTDVVTRAGDYFELSIVTILADGTTKTGVTKRDVENFLVMCQRWLNDGSNGIGQGLDYVITANSGTVGVP